MQQSVPHFIVSEGSFFIQRRQPGDLAVAIFKESEREVHVQDVLRTATYVNRTIKAEIEYGKPDFKSTNQNEGAKAFSAADKRG